jgi:hypothetical protein
LISGDGYAIRSFSIRESTYITYGISLKGPRHMIILFFSSTEMITINTAKWKQKQLLEKPYQMSGRDITLVEKMKGCEDKTTYLVSILDSTRYYDRCLIVLHSADKCRLVATIKCSSFVLLHHCVQFSKNEFLFYCCPMFLGVNFLSSKTDSDGYYIPTEYPLDYFFDNYPIRNRLDNYIEPTGFLDNINQNQISIRNFYRYGSEKPKVHFCMEDYLDFDYNNENKNKSKNKNNNNNNNSNSSKSDININNKSFTKNNDDNSNSFNLQFLQMEKASLECHLFHLNFNPLTEILNNSNEKNIEKGKFKYCDISLHKFKVSSSHIYVINFYGDFLLMEWNDAKEGFDIIKFDLIEKRCIKYDYNMNIVNEIKEEEETGNIPQDNNFNNYFKKTYDDLLGNDNYDIFGKQNVILYRTLIDYYYSVDGRFNLRSTKKVRSGFLG